MAKCGWFEEELIKSRNQDLDAVEQARKREVDAALAQARRDLEMQTDRGITDPGTLQPYAASVQLLENIANQVSADATKRAQQAAADLQLASARRQAQYAKLSGLIAQLNGFKGYGVAPSYVPNTNLSLGPWSPWSFQTSPTGLGMGFRFGKLLSGKLGASTPDPVTTDVSAVFDVMSKFQVGVGYKSQYGVDGFNAGYYGIWRVSPKAGDQPAETNKASDTERRLPLP